MPIDNYYTLKLNQSALMNILSKDIIEKVITYETSKNQYVALLHIHTAGPDPYRGWVELLPNGTFRLQPTLKWDSFKHHLDEQRIFNSIMTRLDIINKLNNWSSTVESKYEIKPPSVYPKTYERPTSKGTVKCLKNTN